MTLSEVYLLELTNFTYENILSKFNFCEVLYQECALVGMLGCFYVRHLGFYREKIAKSRRICMTALLFIQL